MSSASLRRGGHDPVKVYNAFKRAVEHKGQPTVILAKTVKGYGLGEAGEGKNITHQQKKLNEEELFYLANRFGVELTKEQIHEIAFVKPGDDSPEVRYLKERREALGGYLPVRAPKKIELKAPPLETFSDSLAGSRGREASTTAGFVAVLKALLKHAGYRQVRGADHSRRSAHVRHGIDVPRARHLRERTASFISRSIATC